MKEIEYPIYSFGADIEVDGKKDGLLGHKFSTREKITPTLIGKWTRGWWKAIEKQKPGIKILKLELIYHGDDTWFLSWFAHQSMNYFATQEEAFASFEKWLNAKGYEFSKTDYHPDNHNNEIGCPMGADDKWRWKFCGCEKCKKQQITVIKH